MPLFDDCMDLAMIIIVATEIRKEFMYLGNICNRKPIWPLLMCPWPKTTIFLKRGSVQLLFTLHRIDRPRKRTVDWLVYVLNIAWIYSILHIVSKAWYIAFASYFMNKWNSHKLTLIISLVAGSNWNSDCLQPWSLVVARQC